MNLKSSFFKVCETLDKIKYTTFDFDQFFWGISTKTGKGIYS